MQADHKHKWSSYGTPNTWNLNQGVKAINVFKYRYYKLPALKALSLAKITWIWIPQVLASNPCNWHWTPSQPLLLFLTVSKAVSNSSWGKILEKPTRTALASVAQLVGASFHNQKVAGMISGQSLCLDYGVVRGPVQAHLEVASHCFSLASMVLSLPSSPQK